MPNSLTPASEADRPEADAEFWDLVAEVAEALRHEDKDTEDTARLLGPDGELRRQETVASHARRVFAPAAQ
jgi:hypothetical protein